MEPDMLWRRQSQHQRLEDPRTFAALAKPLWGLGFRVQGLVQHQLKYSNMSHENPYVHEATPDHAFLATLGGLLDMFRNTRIQRHTIQRDLKDNFKRLCSQQPEAYTCTVCTSKPPCTDVNSGAAPEFRPWAVLLKHAYFRKPGRR